MEFGECLKRIRTARGISLQELAKRAGITQVAASCWENGSRQPGIKSLRAICKALDVSADSLLDIPQREYLIAASLEPASETNKDAAADCFIPRYISVAAAGPAAPNDDSQFELIRVSKRIPQDADFAVVISGSSMEPYIKDGETVYVKRTDDLKLGDIGLFSVDGATVCKMLYKTGRGDIYLVSSNPEEAGSNIFIPRDSSTTFVCLGRVLLKKTRKLPKYFEDSL